MPAIQPEDREFQAALNLLGGREVFGKLPSNTLEVHDMIVAGIPAKALFELIEALPLVLHASEYTRPLFNLDADDLAEMAGGKEPLSPVLSDRIWRFAIVAALIVDLFGELDVAERILLRRSPYLQNRCPLDWMTSAIGAHFVWEHFKRLDYGIYA